VRKTKTDAATLRLEADSTSQYPPNKSQLAIFNI
jgi:hypothetical protein